MKIAKRVQWLWLVAFLAMSSCFTGVENTPKITEKDVQRTMSVLERRQPTTTLTPYVDSIATWRVDKQFYVTDNQVLIILDHRVGINADSLSLAGKCLNYSGYDIVTALDNREVVDVKFTIDSTTLVYHSGKTMAELSSSFSIPLLIDMDMVAHVASQLEGRDAYVKTPIWYDLKTENMIRGRQFIKVHIDHVKPGNKVLPLRVVFTASDNAQQAFVWMSSANSVINNRDYDALFTARDVHDNYPDISNEVWRLIINGDVAVGMTKEECRLSKGAPKQIGRRPSQTEVTEFWYYDGGSYLQFVDGLLQAYRK